MFFTYYQNNSGGMYDTDVCAGISEYVIVEAHSPKQANALAEAIGLYFDGADDCDCCGNRWYEKSDSEKGDEKPEIYGEDVLSYRPMLNWGGSKPFAYVHYLDGTVKEVL